MSTSHVALTLARFVRGVRLFAPAVCAILLLTLTPRSALADDAGATEPATPSGPQNVTYHGNDSGLTYRVGHDDLTAKARAQSATRTLGAAIDNHKGAAADLKVQVAVGPAEASIRIGETVIGMLYRKDAEAAGLAFSDLAARVESELSTFVASQLRRKALQLFFLHLFLSVFVIVIAFLTLRAARTAFDGWDERLNEKRAHLPPISILRIPVISREALGGMLAFGLALGRYAAYVITSALALATVLSQFESTRPLLKRLVKFSTEPVLTGVQTIASAIPGLVVAALLFALTRAGLRVLNLLLDGVQSGQLKWKRVPARRVPLFRTLAATVAFLLIVPLMIASAFGSFDTPWGTLALVAAGSVVVGALPLIASFVIGAVILWTEAVKLGDWVQVGNVSGEVAALTFRSMRLVPEGGGTVTIPYLTLAFRPVHSLREAPALAFDVRVQRDGPAGPLRDKLKTAILAREADASVELRAVRHHELVFRVATPSIRTGSREAVLVAISDAADAGHFRLAGDIGDAAKPTAMRDDEPAPSAQDEETGDA